jgi:hypothetical protein
MKLLGFLWSIFLFFFRVFMTITIFILYGYVEKIFQYGIIVAIALSLYLMRYVCLKRSLFLLAIHLLAHYYEYRVVVFISFYFMDALYFFGGNKNDDDTFVKLQPYEKEIRQLLFKYNPEALGRVDSLLLKYKGRERDLLKKIRDKYEPHMSELMSPSNNVKHEDVYPATNDTAGMVLSGGRGSTLSAKDDKFEIRNPLSDQIAKQQERSKAIRESGRGNGGSDDPMLTYGKIYENEDEFETSNPMVEDSPSGESKDHMNDNSPFNSVLRYRGTSTASSEALDTVVQEQENPMLALRSSVATPMANRNPLLSSSTPMRRQKFDQSLIEQAKREAQENARRMIEERYGPAR